MNTIIINITEYDKSDQTRIEYTLDKTHFNDPFLTLPELAKHPERFLNNEGDYHLLLTGNQNARFLNYLKTNNYHRESFGDPCNAQYLLTFSYGQNPDVNMELASIVYDTGRNYPRIDITVQWEIANLIYYRDPAFAERIHRIDFDYDKDYINSAEIIDKFLQEVYQHGNQNSKPEVFLVAQAWHAPRCIALCETNGLTVTGGKFSERFSPSDPQKWVRNAFSWVMKEGTK